jgi:hypothetical protein
MLIHIVFFLNFLFNDAVLRLYRVDDWMINEYGAVDGTKIGRGNQSTWRKPTHATLSTTYPIMTWPGIELGHHSGLYITGEFYTKETVI